jgi:NADH dehydrogenase
MKKIVIIGGGFAGLWSAISAARHINQLQLEKKSTEILLLNRDQFHGIRVRFYEKNLNGVRVPLDTVLNPIGVKRIQGSVTSIDSKKQVIVYTSGKEEKKELHYDRLILAAGSHLHWPDIPGLKCHAFNVDTFHEATRLKLHLSQLNSSPKLPGSYTVVVVGAGFTGIEVACEMVERMSQIVEKRESVRDENNFQIILVDSAPHVGSVMGEEARLVIEEALESLGIDKRLNAKVHSISEKEVLLESGECIPARTVIWTAGMRASPLTSFFSTECDELGRLSVDKFLRIKGVKHVFAAGDVARAMTDEHHFSVMSCQHGRQQGKFAGHNAVADLLGEKLIPYKQEHYTTILDLGLWGALYTMGWERKVLVKGKKAKATKKKINRIRIYPPRTGNVAEIFQAGEPIILPPPSVEF